MEIRSVGRGQAAGDSKIHRCGLKTGIREGTGGRSKAGPKEGIGDRSKAGA